MAIHHTTTQKIQHVHEWRASGLTRLQYCHLHGLSSHTFHEWLRLPDDGVPVAEYPVLLPVCIQPSPDPAPVGSVITLHLPGGYRIDCRPAQLPDVLRAVKRRTGQCCQCEFTGTLRTKCNMGIYKADVNQPL